MSTEHNVFILDDDDALRDALLELFISEGLKPQTFTSAEAFLSWDLWKRHGCAVVDIHMQGMTGLELLAELKARGSKLSVVIITGQSDVPKAVNAFKAGAVDFIEKPFDPVHLVDVVKKALRGSQQKQQEEDELSHFRGLVGQLSIREREVMDLVATGNSNKAIALKLEISARTVETHRAKMMEKTKCANVSSLVAMALRLNPDLV